MYYFRIIWLQQGVLIPQYFQGVGRVLEHVRQGWGLALEASLLLHFQANFSMSAIHKYIRARELNFPSSTHVELVAAVHVRR